MKYLFQLTAVILVIALAIVAGAPSKSAAALIGANSQQAACNGISLGSQGCSSGTSAFGNLLKTVINVLSFIAGVAAIIMIIVGGFNYITSGGEASKTASARNTIIYALVGLVLVVLAQVLVHFVLNRSISAANAGILNRLPFMPV